MKALYERLRAMRSGDGCKEYDSLFRRVPFGGYCKEDVARYIRRLEEGLRACEQDGAAQAEKNRKNDALIEEAIEKLQQLREENKRLLARIGEQETS